MSTWRVRKEGSPEIYSLPTEGDVLTGLRDGNFLPTDEVRGPTDTDWQPLETHPTFAETALEVEPPPAEVTDETHLDMNPLIDVCLVLLIFFILTITYASLERAITVPEDSAEEKGSNKVDINQLKDRVFLVVVKLEANPQDPTAERTVIKMGTLGALKEVPLERVYAEMQQLINTTGRKEMVLDIDKLVPWGVETAILDAAKGNKVHNIINNQRERR